MYYFRFKIPHNQDGTIVTYSKNWSGTMPKCPQNVEVLLYNDIEGWGIARTDDTFVPSEVEVMEDALALALVSEANDEAGIYFGDKLAHRWDIVDGPGAMAIKPWMKPKMAKVLAVGFCGKCMSVRHAKLVIPANNQAVSFFITAKCHVCGEPVKLKVMNAS